MKKEIQFYFLKVSDKYESNSCVFRKVNEYLIKWKNLPEDEATWEDDEFRSKHLSLPML
jgi:hypothetical protein